MESLGIQTSDDKIKAKLLSMTKTIDRDGFTIMYSKRRNMSVAYTVGLHHMYDHPDFVIAGNLPKDFVVTFLKKRAEFVIKERLNAVEAITGIPIISRVDIKTVGKYKLDDGCKRGIVENDLDVTFNGKTIIAPIGLVRVESGSIDTFCGWARKWYGEVSNFTQFVFPDSEGKLPWDEGYAGESFSLGIPL